jgi:UDP:flavonoid glycosyltransferase YjiC (YdhE family)
VSGARILVAAFGDAGHAFPALGLGRALAERGHNVTVETWEKWREATEAVGLRFQAAEEYTVFPPPPPGSGPGAAEAALAMMPLLEDLDPKLVVSDILTLAPALAAERHGSRRATLIPHLYPVHQPGNAFFSVGAMPPRTPLGRGLWRAGLPLLETGLRRGRSELNASRARLGLPPVDRFHGGISEELALVATYPELEHPREWPASVRVTGPLRFELPYPDVELPEGEGPLVLIASSTAHDRSGELVRRSFEALAGEPVRVLAATNGPLPPDPIEVPANGRLVEWVSYSQVMPAASVVVCHGGHGTVCRAIEAGRPVLASPSVGDMAENAVRVQWAGCGLSVPARLRRPRPLRWAVKELLSDRGYARRASEIADGPGRDGAARAVAAIEELLAG